MVRDAPPAPSRTGAGAYAAHRAGPGAPDRGSYAAHRATPGSATKADIHNPERQMAGRMRDMASDLANALESGAQKERHAPPLSVAYQSAVATRDSAEQRERALGLPERSPGGRQPAF